MRKLFHSMMALLLTFAMLSTSVSAVSITYDSADGDYYNLISKKDWDLAPGIVESELVLNNDAGDRRQVMHVVEVDMDNEYARVIPSTKGMIPTAGSYGVQTMDHQAAYAEANGYGNVVAAMNISLSWYDSTYYDEHPELIGEPLGYLILDGVQYTNSRGKTSGAQTCLVINYDEKDGVARPADIPKTQIRSTADDITGWEEQVIPANFGFLVKDGKMVYTSEEHTSEGASRSMLGIKADGTIVMVMNDGRQAPYSTGFNNYEMSEAMLKLGCVYAINGDGGGSSQFLSQRPGEELKVNCSPSDGALRATTHGVLAISTAPSTGEFVRAHVETDNEYYTPGSSVKFNAIGADLAGGAAEIPADAYWQLSDDTMGTIDENGLFVSNGTTGEVTAQLMYNGEAKGSATIKIVVPDAIAFGGAAAYTVPFNETVTFNVTATYGVYDVALKPADYTISVANTTLGTINGSKYTSGETAGNTTVTVTLNANSAISTTVPLTVGKGSEVIFSFEDGTLGTDMDDWQIKDHEGKHTPYADISVVTTANGMVHNGKNALAVHMPMHTRVHGGEGYAANSITWLGDPILLENATSIGMWVYVPEEATQTEIALNYVWYNDSGVQQRTTPDLCLNDYFNGNESSGWHYLSVPISKTTAYIEDATYVAQKQGYKRNFFLKFYVTNSGNAGDETSYMGDITYYIDDITIDYSDAVDDRIAPKFTATSVNNIATDTESALTAGTTANLNSKKLGFTATVTDNNALDTASAKVYVDGKKISASCRNGKITSGDIELTPGVHRIVYEIADTMGNVSKAVRYIKVAGDDVAVNVVPHNTDQTVALTSSLYWVDVVASNAEKVEEIALKLDLDTMHKWELSNTELAYNYDIDYYYESVADEKDNVMTIVLTNNGSDATGKAVLASIPVRVWSYCGNDTGSDLTPAKAWTSGYVPAVSVNVEVEAGEVVYNDNTSNTFSAEKIHVDTEAYIHQYKMDKTYFANNTYHVHTEEALDDVDATCTTDGYTDRTYCSVCNSVVNWGTTQTATGHDYKDIDGKRQCGDCGDLFTGTFDGKEYVDGVIAADGWVDGKYYYIDGAKVTGVNRVPAADGSGEFCYDFGEDGINKGLYSGLYTKDGKTYIAINGVPKSGWQMPSDKWYYFDPDTYAAVTGEYTTGKLTYVFAEDGSMISGAWHTTDKGTRYYYGPSFYMYGWKEIDGKTYYFGSPNQFEGYIYKGYNYVKETGNSTIRWYDFGEDGALIGNLTHTGLMELNGKTYYMEDGYAKLGLVKVDDDYYYFSSSDLAAVTGRYYITNVNDTGYTQGWYNFDADGKMIKKNGIIDENGVKYYYENDVKTYAGLIEIDGDFYYVRSNAQVATGRYWVSKANTSVTGYAEGWYEFDDDGKMIMKNGIVEEDGALWYYVNDKKVGAGLIEIDGDFYYVRSNGQVVTERYYITRVGDTDFVAGWYNFDADGKMIVRNGIVEEDGALWYYENDRKVGAGLIEIDGDFYYVRSNAQVAVGRYWVSRVGDTDFVAGWYNFGSDGKMDYKNGIIEEDGALWYYENDRKVGAGLIEIDGDFYYVRSNGQVVTERYYITRVGDTGITAGWYDFDENGKMDIKHGIVEEDGALWYYRYNKKAGIGMIEINGDYYYARTSGEIVTGRYYITRANDTGFAQGWYNFDETGKMIR